ncbi:hypothetical protein Amme1_00015 [Pseudomonas phage vB_PpuM-Amme-1]
MFVPIAQAADTNVIGTEYETWEKGVAACLRTQVVGGYGCDNGNGVKLFSQFVQAILESNGREAYKSRVVALDYRGDGAIIIHYVFTGK